MSTEQSSIPAVLTFGQFAARGGYDCEISHDRLRFPHGISKIQAKRNKSAAQHHLREALRAARDYAAAVAAGAVRPPTADEDALGRLFAHPDHESTKATWRVRVKRLQRQTPGLDPLQAVAQVLRDTMDALDPWAEILGVANGAPVEVLAEARLRWMRPSVETAG